jgi:hypothetical protein
MAMADRDAAEGRLRLRGMISLEPWTINGCGYPDLLASGEVCEGEPIHDQQHPHDLFMELAVSYERPLSDRVRWQLYGGPAGEPALGPTAFPHRISATPSPLAPITHHWLDSTHVTYGVLTGGVSSRRWKAEASLFNGREPDEHRTGFDFAPLYSRSARLWFLPTARWALQFSGGRLKEAEAGHDGGPRVDVDRLTASATYHRTFDTSSIWATTIGWGRNQEAESSGTNGLLVESNLTLRERDTFFARFEVAQKSGHDLALESDDRFAVAKLQASYTRYLAPFGGLAPGLGGGFSVALVPASLVSTYGSRANLGAAVFVTIRPSRM